MKKLFTAIVNYYATHFPFPPRGFKIFFQCCKLFGTTRTYFRKKLPGGIMMKLNIVDHIQRELFWHGGYETVEVKYICSLLDSSDNFLDAGANIGNHTLTVAKHITEGFVIAFEPSPATFEHLQRNISLNHFKNIIPVQKALSDTNNTAQLYLSGNENTGSSGLSPSQEYSGDNIRVETITGDEWLEKNGHKKIWGMKIDVEGHEMQVLKGLQRTIERDKPFIMIEILVSTLERFGHSPQDIYQFFEAMSYTPWKLNNESKLIPVPSYTQEGYSIFFFQETHLNRLNIKPV